MSRKLKIGSLFAGIGGFDLGLERTGGFETAWFCEQADYPTKILNQRWPGVPVYPDVTELKGNEIEPVDILVGGFPCQDISAAGRGAGITGARSGLWSEFARLIGELRPRYVIAENSPLLKTRGLNAVLGSLAAIGYDAEWDCIPACAVGAHHQRDRIWIVAYPSSPELEGHGRPFGDEAEVPDFGGVVPGGGAGHLDREDARETGSAANPSSPEVEGHGPGDAEGHSACDRTGYVADPSRDAERGSAQAAGPERKRTGKGSEPSGGRGASETLADAQSEPEREPAVHPDALAEGWEAWHVAGGRCERGSSSGGAGTHAGTVESRLVGLVDGVSGRLDSSWPWASEPPIPRVAEGVPDRVARLSALGNALVPDIPEWLGYRILEWESRMLEYDV